MARKKNTDLAGIVMHALNGIESVPIEDIKPYDRNPRVHSPDQVETIKRSIAEFGFTTPCLIDEKNRLIAGHGRHMAAEELGLAEIPCIRADGWSEEQKRAYTIADNKITESSRFDIHALIEEIELLDAADFDVTLTGFDLDEIAALGDDWQSDIEQVEKLAASDEDAPVTIKISCPADAEEEVREIVAAALQEFGGDAHVQA